MSRLFYTTIFLLIICLKSYAQQVIWSENFEYYYQTHFSAPWAVQGNTGSVPWACDIDYYTGGICFPSTDNNTRVAGVRDGAACYAHHADSNELLITPVINLAGYTAAAFKYDSYFTRKVTNGHPESATVEVSTDGGNTWTILRNAPVSVGNHYETQFVNLGAYAGNSIRLGFRYSDKGQDSMTGWMIDNLVAFIPPQNDLALISAGLTDTLMGYALVGDSFLVTGKVMNNGAQPVTSYTIGYKFDNGTVYRDSINGINIAPFDTGTFQLNRQALMNNLGRHIVKMWVHSAGDANSANDSANAIFHGASFIPDKLTVLEAGTGTWYPFAPQQYVIMNALKTSDYPIAVIAVHDQDPMEEDVAYRDYILHFKQNNIPFFIFDRHDKIIPNRYVVKVDVNGNNIYALFTDSEPFAQFLMNRAHFGFADISLKPSYSSLGVSIEATVKPAMDLSGAYRLALILTEDKCKGTSTGYDQANYYAGNNFGAMGGYESLPDPVPASAMQYNSIGRGAFPAPDGDPGSLPVYMAHDQGYVATLSANIKSTWKRSNMLAIVLLLRQSDSTILNAAQIPLWPLTVNDPNGRDMFDAAIYPNPASTSANLIFTPYENGIASIVATDITGREVFRRSIEGNAHAQQNLPIRTDNWSAGMYLITVRVHNSVKTLKLTVLP